MENVGTWNSDFVVMLVLLMLAPACIAFLVKIYVLISEVCQPVSVEPQESVPTFDDVKRAALKKAADGDRYARDWCSKNVFQSSPIYHPQSKQAQCKQTQPKKVQQKPKPVVNFLTDKAIMLDTVEALIRVGYKKNQAQSLVAHASTQKKYNDVASMFLDIIKTSQK